MMVMIVRNEMYVGFRALVNGAGRDAFCGEASSSNNVGGKERQKVVPEKCRKVSNLLSQRRAAWNCKLSIR